mmetsp:Transcript_21207/g.59235  ORF Transcript_21207/g.59235 Transcript_21207/m.59235 type:complete len:246 (-) Transcript_21207:1306-2043(-)
MSVPQCGHGLSRSILAQRSGGRRAIALALVRLVLLVDHHPLGRGFPVGNNATFALRQRWRHHHLLLWWRGWRHGGPRLVPRRPRVRIIAQARWTQLEDITLARAFKQLRGLEAFYSSSRHWWRRDGSALGPRRQRLVRRLGGARRWCSSSERLSSRHRLARRLCNGRLACGLLDLRCGTRTLLARLSFARAALQLRGLRLRLDDRLCRRRGSRFGRCFLLALARRCRCKDCWRDLLDHYREHNVE